MTDLPLIVDRHPLYKRWHAMIRRCRNPTSAAYKNYGGRGIVVCPRWHSFKNFLADMGLPPPGHTLDRINNDGNYEPGNCRWASRHQQQRNTRRNIKLTIDGVTLTIVEWAEKNKVPKKTAYRRMELGWSPNNAVTMPVRHGVPFERRA